MLESDPLSSPPCMLAAFPLWLNDPQPAPGPEIPPPAEPPTTFPNPGDPPYEPPLHDPPVNPPGPTPPIPREPDLTSEWVVQI